MKPTLGRIVIFNEYPAVVNGINDDGTVNLFVLGPDGQQVVRSIGEGSGEGEWAWPERESAPPAPDSPPDSTPPSPPSPSPSKGGLNVVPKSELADIIAKSSKK